MENAIYLDFSQELLHILTLSIMRHPEAWKKNDPLTKVLIETIALYQNEFKALREKVEPSERKSTNKSVA